MSEQVNALLQERKYSEAFQLLEKLANDGDIKCQSLLGTFYLEGICVPKNKKTAIRLFAKAAKQQDPESCYQIAMGYKEGTVLKLNYEQCFHYLQKCRSLPKAQYQLGICYLKGIGVEKDEEKAKAFLIESMNNGNENAAIILGYLYFEDEVPETEKAFKCFEHAARQENILGMVNLAYCYEEGLGTLKDMSQAYTWYRKAAELDDADAQYSVGKLETKYKEKKEWLEKAAKQEHTDACFELANLLFQSKSKHDIYEAFSWLRKVACLDDPEGCYRVGKCYQNGHGTLKQQHKAFYWFEKAMEVKHPQATFELGLCYIYGLGTFKNIKKGIELLEKSLKMGVSEAKFELSQVRKDDINE